MAPVTRSTLAPRESLPAQVGQSHEVYDDDS